MRFRVQRFALGCDNATRALTGGEGATGAGTTATATVASGGGGGGGGYDDHRGGNDDRRGGGGNDDRRGCVGWYGDRRGGGGYDNRPPQPTWNGYGVAQQPHAAPRPPMQQYGMAPPQPYGMAPPQQYGMAPPQPYGMASTQPYSMAPPQQLPAAYWQSTSSGLFKRPFFRIWATNLAWSRIDTKEVPMPPKTRNPAKGAAA